MKFQVNGKDETYTLKFLYDKVQKQYVIESREVEARRFINSETKEVMYAFFLKSKSSTSAKEAPVPDTPFEIKKGYVGYSASTGCWYYGTLYIDNAGNELFVAATGMNALLNPPLCGYWYA